MWGLALGPVSLGQGSFSDLDIEFTEAKLTLDSVVAENRLLKQQLAEAKEAVVSLTNSLAIANGEAEVFRREAAEQRLRMEALGVDGLSADKSKLEQRLLKAVRDLQLVQAEKDKLGDQVIQLSEAILRYTKSATTEDGEARLALEGQMRNAANLLGIPSQGEGEGGAGEASEGRLGRAMVISIKEELSLVVANIGSMHGVKVGMPFRVYRGNREVGLVRAVDVREKICGSVIQSLDTEQNKIKVGDHLRVDAR